MAEIKVLEPIKSEISSFKTAGAKLTAETVSLDAPNMPAAKKYAEQQRNIQELIRLYQQLVVKDAKDIAAIIENIRAVDTNMANEM